MILCRGHRPTSDVFKAIPFPTPTDYRLQGLRAAKDERHPGSVCDVKERRVTIGNSGDQKSKQSKAIKDESDNREKKLRS